MAVLSMPFNGYRKTKKADAEKICIGQGFRGQMGNGIGIGSCTAKFSTNLHGCPPTAREMTEFLMREISIYLHPLEAKKKETAQIMSDHLKALRNGESVQEESSTQKD